MHSVWILYINCIHVYDVHYLQIRIDLYKIYTKCLHTKCIPHFNKLLHTKCILNVCIQNISHISTNLCIHFVYISCIHLVQFLYTKCIHSFHVRSILKQFKTSDFSRHASHIVKLRYYSWKPSQIYHNKVYQLCKLSYTNYIRVNPRKQNSRLALHKW